MGMHQTVVVAFDLEWEAGEALERMLELETSGAIRVDDAVVVTTDDSGVPHVCQTHHPPGLGAVGGLLGLLVGALLPGGFGIAAAGLAAGTASARPTASAVRSESRSSASRSSGIWPKLFGRAGRYWGWCSTTPTDKNC